MTIIKIGYYKSPIGVLKISSQGEYIIGLDFSEELHLESSSPIIEECKTQLEEYFKGERREFHIKIKFIKGTEFQKSVWEELKNIPYGEVVAYKDIAEKIQNPKAVRAVGGANNKNPIAIIIPCHRVIGKNGNMVGYAGGINKKEFLLDLEKQNLK